MHSGARLMQRGAHRRVSMTLPQLQQRKCTISLRRPESDLLALLLVSPPERFVPMELMIGALWPNPDDEPEYAEDNVGQHIYNLRKVGIVIENYWGRGWRIPASARGA